MSNRRIGIIMHGITGRMGYNQHLVRSIVAIRDQGGVTLSNGDRAMPDPILVGRNLEKVSTLAARPASSARTDRRNPSRVPSANSLQNVGPSSEQPTCR